MAINAENLISDFIQNYNLHYQSKINMMDINHEILCAPHCPRPLPKEQCAVYVFSLPSNDLILKVGRVGAKSNARFQSQHYNPDSASSTLAGSITKNPILWDLIGFNGQDVGEWLRKNTCRTHFFIHETKSELLEYLEIFMKGHLRPVFEGH
jgi:hypothetical protein